MDSEELSRTEARIRELEAQNAELKQILEAVKSQLEIYDSLILYPTYERQLASYPESQRPMLELAMKANFFKTHHEINRKTLMASKSARNTSPDSNKLRFSKGL